MDANKVKERLSKGRQMGPLVDKPSYTVTPDDEVIRLIDTMQGSWSSGDTGWNLIALPFKDSTAPANYRVLMNQYNETLHFKFADRNVPNRGITEDSNSITDQLIDAVDYEQTIKQVEAEDFPSSSDSPTTENLLSSNGKGIHHEPGLVLQILNHQAEHDGDKLHIARLATIPHGDSVLAMGKVKVVDGAPTIPDLNALPIHAPTDITHPYLAPYKHFEDNRFFGTAISVPGFPGFFPTNANAILQFGIQNLSVAKTTILHFDTKFDSGGIVNIPFIVREANATEMEATFWIMELNSTDAAGNPEIVMMYSQTVFLDFFESRTDPGKIVRWPHVSINRLTRG